MALPFDGAISQYYAHDAPDDIRRQIVAAEKGEILAPDYPHAARLGGKAYRAEMALLQQQLVRFQAGVRDSGQRVVVVFEGRDAAGKGGSIKRVTENLNPRVARVVALSKPSDREATEWYFQRYITHLPAAGEIVLFDRSWYNRAVIEKVFGFCTDDQRTAFFRQLPEFEDMLIDEGIRLVKIWLNVGRAEQLRRFLAREQDPLKQWKLSAIDVRGLPLWDAYTTAIGETFDQSHRETSPWVIIRSDDKRRARLEVIRAILARIDYDGRDTAAIGARDTAISGGPEIWHG